MNIQTKQIMSKNGKIGKGDCLVWTGEFAIYNHNKPLKDLVAPNGEKFIGVPVIVHAAFKIKDRNETICHAFIQDDEYVYDRIGRGKKERYEVTNKELFYSRGLNFNLFDNEQVKAKIVEYKIHTIKELFDLMVVAGHKFQKFGIETDY